MPLGYGFTRRDAARALYTEMPINNPYPLTVEQFQAELKWLEKVLRELPKARA